MSGFLRITGFATASLAAVLLCAAGASARPGMPDPSFGNEGIVATAPAGGEWESPSDLAESPDGRYVVAGRAASGVAGSIVFKYLPDGRLDPGFGNLGQVRASGEGWDQVEVLDNGKMLLAAGSGTQLRFARLDADGSPDPSFGSAGTVTLSTNGLFTPPDGVLADAEISSLAILGDGSVRTIGVFAGCPLNTYSGCADAFIAGTDGDGNPDSTFGSGGVKKIGIGGRGILSAILPDGNSVVVRSATGDPPYGDILYSTPVSASGVPGDTKIITQGHNYYWSDLDFFSGGAATVDSSGRVLLTDSDYLWRLLPDGSGDPDFGVDGLVELRDLTKFLPEAPGLHATGVAIDGQGRLLISGGVSSGVGKQQWGGDTWASNGAVARLSPDGSIDNSFGGGGLQILWHGKRSNKKLVGSTEILSSGGSVVVAGRGPVGDDFGFTLARAVNDQMELPRCNGQIVDYVGSPGRDRVEAHEAVVSTLGGDDVVSFGYRSTICSGDGDDSVRLTFGPAKVLGGNGADRIVVGENGSSLMRGGAGPDRITGGNQADRLFGDSGDDLILGGNRNDRIFGGGGDDRLFGQGGRDWLFGGTGLDVLKVGPLKPDPTDYPIRSDSGTARVATLGTKAVLSYRLELQCRGEPDHRVSRGASSSIPFDPVTGKLARVTGTMDDVFDDYGGFVSDIRARVKNGRITGQFRIIDNWGSSLCRSGEGPVRRGTLLKDAWVPFSAKAEPKPRQIARQD